MTRRDFLSLDRRDLLVAEKLLEVRDKRIEFATKYHRNTHGERMDFVRNAHLPQIYNTLAKSLVIQGSVQSKKSEFIIIDHFAAAACGLNIFFVLPKVESRTTYVQNRIDKRIGETPEYRAYVRDGFFDNTVLKHFGKGTIKYVGSNVLSDMREYPADMLFVEELDQCAGTNVQYARDRLRGSIYQFRRYIGNPSLKGVGINRMFESSTRNFWHIPCEKCGQPIPLDWFKTVVIVKHDDDGNFVDYSLRDQEWRRDCGRDIHCMCPTCDVPLNRQSTAGLWVPENPSCDTEGYSMTMLNSWENSIYDIFTAWEDAWESAAGLEHFYTSNLGIPFVVGNQRLTVQTLRKAAHLRDPYSFTTEKHKGYLNEEFSRKKCSMGVDVGKKFDVRISEVLPDGVRKAIFIGKVSTLQELISLGVQFNVQVAVIDAMPEFRTVLDFQEEAPFFVWSCSFGSEGADKRIKKDKKNRSIAIDRTAGLDRTLAEFKAGKNLLPINFESLLEGEYVKEMTEPVRQEETDTKGNTKFVWSKGKDHQRFADLYDYLAATFVSSSSLDTICVG
jgi:hypothetical protein